MKHDQLFTKFVREVAAMSYEMGMSLEEIEREFRVRVLDYFIEREGSISAAARKLDAHRNLVGRVLRERKKALGVAGNHAAANHAEAGEPGTPATSNQEIA